MSQLLEESGTAFLWISDGEQPPVSSKSYHMDFLLVPDLELCQLWFSNVAADKQGLVMFGTVSAEEIKSQTESSGNGLRQGAQVINNGHIVGFSKNSEVGAQKLSAHRQIFQNIRILNRGRYISNWNPETDGISKIRRPIREAHLSGANGR